TLRRLLRLLRTHRIEAIHWNFTWPLANAYLWWLSAMQPGLAHYVTDHISRFLPMPDPPRGPKRWLKKLLLRRYAKVFCISDFVRECLHRQGTWPEQRTWTCRYFVNTDRFRPDATVREQVRRELGAQGRFVVLA